MAQLQIRAVPGKPEETRCYLPLPGLGLVLPDRLLTNHRMGVRLCWAAGRHSGGGEGTVSSRTLRHHRLLGTSESDLGSLGLMESRDYRFSLLNIPDGCMLQKS